MKIKIGDLPLHGNAEGKSLPCEAVIIPDNQCVLRIQENTETRQKASACFEDSGRF